MWRTIPNVIKNQLTIHDNTQDNIQDVAPNTQDVIDKEQKILVYCEIPRSKKEIAKYLGYKTIKSIKVDVELLLDDNRIVMTIPDKPKSKNQKYVAVKNMMIRFCRRRLQNYNI